MTNLMQRPEPRADREAVPHIVPSDVGPLAVVFDTREGSNGYDGRTEIDRYDRPSTPAADYRFAGDGSEDYKGAEREINGVPYTVRGTVLDHGPDWATHQPDRQQWETYPPVQIGPRPSSGVRGFSAAGNFDLHRVGGILAGDATPAASRKVREAAEKAITAYAAEHPEAVAEGVEIAEWNRAARVERKAREMFDEMAALVALAASFSPLDDTAPSVAPAGRASRVSALAE